MATGRSHFLDKANRFHSVLYEADFEFQQVKSRQIGNAVGSSLFSGAFDQNLGDFGNVQERELIDASQVQMSTFFGENAEGGTTKISAGTFGNAEEDGPRTPPWEQSKSDAPASTDTLLSAPVSDPLLSASCSERACCPTSCRFVDTNASNTDRICTSGRTRTCSRRTSGSYRSYTTSTSGWPPSPPPSPHQNHLLYHHLDLRARHLQGPHLCTPGSYLRKHHHLDLRAPTFRALPILSSGRCLPEYHPDLLDHRYLQAFTIETTIRFSGHQVVHRKSLNFEVFT